MCSLRNPIKFCFVHLFFFSILSGNSGQVQTSGEVGSPVKCDQRTCPIGTKGNYCSGHGQCDCTHHHEPSCICEKDWVGATCQYELSSLTCENLRACVQCQVHLTGPLSEGNDCEEFCSAYPRPFVMKKLYLRKHEIFCSFIDSSNSTDCRFFFKLGNLALNSFPLSKHTLHLKGGTHDLNEEYSNGLNTDVYIIAKKDKECQLDRKSRNTFPHSVIFTENKEFMNEEGIKYLYDEEKTSENRGNSYTTLMILFIFIVLPFVTCIVSCFVNISSLPCGLCNIFRRPSSTYLRNVRSYPGVVVLSSPSEV